MGGNGFKRHCQPLRSWQGVSKGVIRVAIGTGLTLICLGLVGSATATEPNVIRVGIYPSQPKVFRDEQGRPAGFFPEVIQEIARREDWTLEYIDCDWAVCLKAVETGDLDLMVDVSYSQQRDNRFDFNREVLFPSWSVVFARPGIEFNSVLDLHNQRIAVLENGIQYEALQTTSQEFGIQPIFVQSPDYVEMFQMLERGEIDGVVVNRFFPAQRHFAKAINTNILIKPDQVHFAAPEGDPDGLLAAIDRQVAEMKNQPDSIYYQAGKRWLEGLSIHKPDWVLMGQIAALAGGVVLSGFAGLLIFWNRRLRQEVDDRIAAQDQLRHQAMHDSLTNLPNRHFLLARLEATLTECHTTGNLGGTILFLDLDRFKVVNDSLGHVMGDQLLVEVAQRLQQKDYWVARLGGDEFVIYLAEVTDRDRAIETAEAVLATLQTPCVLNNHEIVIRGSIGIVVGFSDYHDPSELLRDADIAMYWSKDHGRNGYTIFTQEMRDLATKQLALEGELRRAITHQELTLHYQPIVALETSCLVGFEALVRWQHPSRGLLPPGVFIPLAEDTGLIVPLGWWVLETACRQLQQWQTNLPTQQPLMLNVNVSAAQLNQSDFLEKLDYILAATGLSGASLVIEITESLLIDNLPTTCHLLKQLRERSIGVSIDDFGTGYSSFGSLHHLPITNLKIDRSFISRMVDQSRNQDIVKTIVMLAHQLGVKATAEGIETEEQRLMLGSLSCDLGQGYLFDKPLPAESIEHWLVRDRPAVSLRRQDSAA